jgi:hypothetical protein
MRRLTDPIHIPITLKTKVWIYFARGIIHILNTEIIGIK